MITGTTAAVTAVAALLAAGISYVGVTGNSKQSEQTRDSYLNLQSLMYKKGLDGDVQELLGSMESKGLIDADTYEKGIKALANSKDIWENPKKDAKTYWNWATGYSKHKNEEALYNELIEKLPEYFNYDDDIVNRLKQSFYDAIPDIQDVAGPQYFDTVTDHVISKLRDVEPTHLYTGQEMADLHSLNYDPNSYYDLVKQGTSAALDAARFSSDQMNQASMIGDARDQASYLNAMRNAQSKAITSGATEGARAAADLLAMQNRDATYTQNQYNVANQRRQAIDDFILADASAKLTARQQFENLAQSLSTDAAGLYLNDADRWGQDWLTNAEIYTADQNLLGNRIKANLDMEGAYTQAQSAVNAARSAARNQANQYAFILDRFMDANDGKIYKAVQDMDNYIAGQYTGRATQYDYLVNDYYK